MDKENDRVKPQTSSGASPDHSPSQGEGEGLLCRVDTKGV